MSFLTKMFGGGGSSNPKPAPRAAPAQHESTAEKLDNAIETMERKEAVLEKRIAEETAKAKEFLAKKNQKGAMGCLKKKKMYEGQLDKLQAQRMNIETLKMTTQENALQAELIQVQRQVARDIQRDTPNVEEVEKIQDDITDAIDRNKEIAEIMGQPLDGGLDDDELLAELQEMEGEQEDEQFNTEFNKLDSVTVPAAPIPAAKPATAQKDEDEDAIAALTAQLNA